MFHRIIIATDLSVASDEIVANLECLQPLGGKGKGFVEEFFLGSVSQAVAREVHIPLLLVSPRAELGNDEAGSPVSKRNEIPS